MGKKMYAVEGMESNAKEIPFDVRLVGEDGKLNNFLLIEDGVKSKLSLKDFISHQVEIIKRGCKPSEKVHQTEERTKALNTGFQSSALNTGFQSSALNTGRNSFACAFGIRSVASAADGNWIGLTEWKEIGLEWKPINAQFAQIGNENYKDHRGKVSLADQFYALMDGQIVPVEKVDGYWMIMHSRKKSGEFEICRVEYAFDYDRKKCFIAKRDGQTAHAETAKKAIVDVNFEFLRSQSAAEHIKRIKDKGTVNPMDYRLLTGACEMGVTNFLNQKIKGWTWETEMPIAEVIKLVGNSYGSEKLRELVS